jgi:hypothetical protein
MDNLNLFDGSVSAGVLTGTLYSAWTNMPGNNVSANAIDLSQLAVNAKGYGRDIGVGDGLVLIVGVLTTYSTGSSPTLQINFQAAPDNGSGAPGSFTTIVSSPVYTAAQLLAGTELLRMDVPLLSPSNLGMVPKFLQLQYVVGTAAFTTGAIYAAITRDRTALGPYMGYQSGYSNQYI